MGSGFVYSISRFGVSTDEEVLIERAELVQENNRLICRVDGIADRITTTDDVAEAIASGAVLNEIRANQVTRIKAAGAALDLLPFILQVPGDPDEFDETLWSKSQADEHTEQYWVVQPGRCRVAYVNESRWCPWPTPDGQRMLPQDWPMVDLSPTWARLDFSELASMTSGLDTVALGLVTPRVAAGCFNPDFGSLSVKLWPRNSDNGIDAEIFTEWLLEWVTASYRAPRDDFKALLAQLFVEAGWNHRNGIDLSGGRLAAGWGTSLDFGDTDSSEWSLKLQISNAVKSQALDLIAQRGGRLADVVTASRQPDSPEGEARRRAVAEWDERNWAVHEGLHEDDGHG